MNTEYTELVTFESEEEFNKAFTLVDFYDIDYIELPFSNAMVFTKSSIEEFNEHREEVRV